MKTKLIRVLFLSLAIVALQGCVAFPPLIQIEHKENPKAAANNDQILRKLDSIEKRLDQLEKDSKK